MLNCRIKIDTGIVLHVYCEIITRQVAQQNKLNEQLERINWKQLKLFIWMICNDGKSIWQSSLTRTYRQKVLLCYTLVSIWNETWNVMNWREIVLHSFILAIKSYHLWLNINMNFYMVSKKVLLTVLDVQFIYYKNTMKIFIARYCAQAYSRWILASDFN